METEQKKLSEFASEELDTDEKCILCGSLLQEEDLACGANTCIECLYEEEGALWPEEFDSDWDYDNAPLPAKEVMYATMEVSTPVQVSTEAAEFIREKADVCMPDETGGLLFGPVGVGVATKAVHLDNVEEYKGGLYSPDMQEFMNVLLKYEADGMEWKGWWHSHTFIAARPSGIDFANHHHHVPMFIYSTCDDELRAYNWKPGEIDKQLVEHPVEVIDNGGSEPSKGTSDEVIDST